MRKRVALIVAVVFVMALMLAVACGDGENQQSDSKQEKDSKQSGASDGLAVSKSTDVDKATVFIHAKGGYEDVFREVGAEYVYPWGSGFMIDSEGVAVTNNHVVTGASYLRVYVGGEEEARNARVLGYSECSDLALIDIEGEGFPYLEWRNSAIEGGLPVLAAGYPPDPADPVTPSIPLDYSIIDGLVVSEEASGQTRWSSVDSVLQHSATLRGGNSGGPLVDETGKAVGINYAGYTDELGEPTERNLAIGRDEALEIIPQLQKGPLHSIGINGEATTHEDLVPESIAVNSVEAGSPADQLQLKGLQVLEAHGHVIQDFIVSLEGSDLAKKETMQDYCNILRGHNPSDPLSIEVLRLTYDLESGKTIGEQVLTGVLNQTPLSPEEQVPHEQGEHQMN